MLNGKQKRFLRAKANTMNSSFQIGKDGLSENLVEGLDEDLRANELIKVALLKTCETPINEVAIDLCAALHCELVQKIGRTLVLYRRSKDNKIILP